jgi:hypothetical protein
MQSGRILLIVMPAISSLEANTRRTNAAIDERLMKASSTDRLPNYFCWTPSFPHARRVAVGSRGRPDPEFSRAQEHSPMRLPLRPKRFITRPGRANILGIPGGGFACPTTCDVAASSLPYPCCSFSLPAPPLLRAARPISKIRYFTLRLRSRSWPPRFQRRRPSPGDAFVRPGGFPWRSPLPSGSNSSDNTIAIRPSRHVHRLEGASDCTPRVSPKPRGCGPGASWSG